MPVFRLFSRVFACFSHAFPKNKHRPEKIAPTGPHGLHVFAALFYSEDILNFDKVWMFWYFQIFSIGKAGAFQETSPLELSLPLVFQPFSTRASPKNQHQLSGPKEQQQQQNFSHENNNSSSSSFQMQSADEQVRVHNNTNEDYNNNNKILASSSALSSS